MVRRFRKSDTTQGGVHSKGRLLSIDGYHNKEFCHSIHVIKSIVRRRGRSATQRSAGDTTLDGGLFLLLTGEQVEFQRSAVLTAAVT